MSNPVPRAVLAAVVIVAPIASSIAVGQDALTGVVTAITEPDSRFDTEPVDTEWAARMEPFLRGLVEEIAGGEDLMVVSEVQCRTTTCRAVLEHTEAFAALEDAARREWGERAQRLFVEATRPMIVYSQGNLLEGAGSSSVIGLQPGDPSKTIFRLQRRASPRPFSPELPTSATLNSIVGTQ